jgi:hypothetical protein
MTIQEKIQTFPVQPGKNELILSRIARIAKIEGIRWDDIKYFVDHIPVFPNSEGVVYANRIEVTVISGSEAVLWSGRGYEVSKDETWCSWFARHQGWSGGDGIYSFNITDGTDRFDQKPGFLNLFTFGDTFVGRTDWVTRRRYDPLVMVNNSIGFHEHGKEKVRFEFNQTEKGSVCSFVKIDPKLDVSGTIPQNLVSYHLDKPNPGWVSGFNPRKIWLTFDLQIPQVVDAVRIHNYFHPASETLASRGIRIFRLLSSMDGKNWDDLGEYELPMAHSAEDSHTIAVATTARFFKFDIQPQPGIGNYDDEYHEGLFALSRVEFIKGDFLYRDIVAEASSVLSEDSAKSYIWLQDGAVIGKNLYLFPYQVIPDHTQPEGMEFGILGIAMIKIPIENNRPQFAKSVQKRTPLMYYHGGSSYWFGGAVTANTVQAQAMNPDGFIYVYGYKSTGFFRQMIVARVRETEFEWFDRWEYFDGSVWQKDPLKVAPLLDHISTEFSVSQILKGRNKGKWIAVFTYDTNTPYVAYSLGDTLVGPFEKPNVVYKAPEIEIFGQTTYCYNAKAHPQLSESDNILVSYNTNTYSFEHNRANSDVYVPRFLRLKEV